MKNADMMTLNLRRIDVCILQQMMKSYIREAAVEANKETCSDERARIIVKTIDKRIDLLKEIKRQFDEQDA